MANIYKQNKDNALNMEQYKSFFRKRGKQLWVTIPKEIAKRNKINLKSKLNISVSKNLVIIIKER